MDLDIPLNLVRAGAGEPLVLLHGIGGELHMWDPVFDALSGQRDVLAVDLPGFGSSPPLDAALEPTPAALAAAVGGLLDREGIASAHLAGNSLGGWVALELAKGPRARSVTALSPAGLWGRPLLAPGRPARNVARRAAQTLAPLLPRIMASPRGRRLALARVVGHPDRVPPEQALRMVASYARAPAYEATNAAMRQAFFIGGERIRVPVTIAWGELDRLVRRAPSGAPQERSLLLPGCGHIPTFDDPELVARVLLEGSVGRMAA